MCGCRPPAAQLSDCAKGLGPCCWATSALARDGCLPRQSLKFWRGLTTCGPKTLFFMFRCHISSELIRTPMTKADALRCLPSVRMSYNQSHKLQAAYACPQMDMCGDGRPEASLVMSVQTRFATDTSCPSIKSEKDVNTQVVFFCCSHQFESTPSRLLCARALRPKQYVMHELRNLHADEECPRARNAVGAGGGGSVATTRYVVV